MRELAKDTQETEVYELENSTPPGKVVIRKGRGMVIVWPGDLWKLIDRLTELAWTMNEA